MLPSRNSEHHLVVAFRHVLDYILYTRDGVDDDFHVDVAVQGATEEGL